MSAVRASCPLPLAFARHIVGYGETHTACVRGVCMTPSHAVGRAALKGAVHVSRSRQDVAHVKLELLKRLRKATDWLVREESCACPSSSLGQCLPARGAKGHCIVHAPADGAEDAHGDPHAHARVRHLLARGGERSGPVFAACSCNALPPCAIMRSFFITCKAAVIRQL
jgi:hypothetical protein